MTFLTMASPSPGATREAPPPPPLRPPPPGVGAELRGQEAGTNNQVKMRWKSLERSHLFLKNKQQKTRRPSAGCEDTEARTTLPASHSQGHRPTCCPRGPSTGPTARGSPRRSGRPGSALLQPPRSETQANPRPLRSGHASLPGGAARRRLAQGTHTGYHGNAALRQTGPLARTTIPGMWGRRARDICPQYPVVTTGKPRL